MWNQTYVHLLVSWEFFYSDKLTHCGQKHFNITEWKANPFAFTSHNSDHGILDTWHDFKDETKANTYTQRAGTHRHICTGVYHMYISLYKIHL